MNKAMPERPAVARIWIALDASPRSLAALTTAGALAAELGAELAGLFVEDIDLQHLTGLPFAREYCVLSGELRPFSHEEVERAWRREAQAMQRQLAEAAARLSLRWSFRVARGRLAAEMNTLAQALDLIVLGRHVSGGFMAVGTARPTRRAGLAGPVLALFEDVEASAASLDLGAALARRSGAELVLLVHAADEDAYRAACMAAQAAARERGASGRCTWLAELGERSLIRAVRREAAGCLVLADRARFLRQGGLERALDEIECPVVLAR